MAATDAVLLQTDLACIVGILPRERIEPQPLRIELELGLDLEGCGTSGDLVQSVDYGSVDAQLRFLCTEGRFRLIEVLAVAILRLVLAPPGPGESRAALDWATVRIRKPAVMREAVPGVTLRRTAAWAVGGDATAEILADVREVCARRVMLQPGQSVGEGLSGRALLLSGPPRAVALPFEASDGATLLHVAFRGDGEASSRS